MGLFDKILGGQGSEGVAFDSQESFAAVMLVTVAADGHISDEEADTVINVSNRMALFKNQPADEFNNMMRKLIGLLKKHGPDSLLEKAFAGLPKELRETAFAVSADLVFADGSVEEDEKVLLEKIQQAMAVPDDLALRIIEVLMIKNRG